MSELELDSNLLQSVEGAGALDGFQPLFLGISHISYGKISLG